MKESWIGFIPCRSISVIRECRSRWGVDRLGDPGTTKGVLHHLVDADVRKGGVLTSTLPVPEEDPVRGSLGWPRVDEPIEATQQRRRQRHVANPAPFPEDTEVSLPAGPDDVPGREPGQLVEPEAAVGEDPDDELVPLVRHRPFKEIDLVAAEHIPDRLLPPRALRPREHFFALTGCPVEEKPHGSDERVNRVLGDRLAVAVAPLEERGGGTVEGPPVQLIQTGDPLGRAPRQEDGAKGVSVLPVRPGRQPPGSAGDEVVLDKSFQGSRKPLIEKVNGHDLALVNGLMRSV